MAYRRSARRASPSRSRSGSKRRSYSASARTGSRRRATASGRRRASGSRIVKHVIEFVGASPLREGQAVNVGQKVAPRPRTKPRF